MHPRQGPISITQPTIKELLVLIWYVRISESSANIMKNSRGNGVGVEVIQLCSLGTKTLPNSTSKVVFLDGIPSLEFASSFNCVILNVINQGAMCLWNDFKQKQPRSAIVLKLSINFPLLPKLPPHIHPEGGTFVQSLVGASEKGAPGRKHNNWSRVGGGVLAGVAGTGKGGPRGVGGARWKFWRGWPRERNTQNWVMILFKKKKKRH